MQKKITSYGKEILFSEICFFPIFHRGDLAKRDDEEGEEEKWNFTNEWQKFRSYPTLFPKDINCFTTPRSLKVQSDSILLCEEGFRVRLYSSETDKWMLAASIIGNN